MIIANQLIQLSDIKQNIKTAINNKGGVVDDDFNTYAAAIIALPSSSNNEILYGNADIVKIKPSSSSIKSIAANQFKGWTWPTGLVIDLGFENLGESAFENWTSASILNLPASLKTIGSRCFINFTSLLSIVINEGVTTIGSYGFYNCKAAKKIDLPSTLQSLTTFTFAYATACTEIICRAVTPPSILNNTFSDLKTGCIFKVPAVALDAYKAAPDWSNFASQMVGI